jgi:hypothetical protein
MYWSLVETGGEGDHYWRKYWLFDWTVKMSVGHGYRSSHKPREIFAPDLTRDGSMDDYCSAILNDLAELCMNGNMPGDGTGERSIAAMGQSVAYRYRSSPGTSEMFIGTFFVDGV